ncbi:unnamed protein product [marine sediment metagenome]|uniref:Uncharacterized protein n=1 Tax=marine sediment metagenome TaxID=412755 RepID=X0U3W7_9ZZZZ
MVYSDRDLPADAQVELAYLYWSAWWKKNDADTEVTFQVNAGEVNTVTASRWSILPNKPGTYAYSSFADVTSLVGEISQGGDGSSYIITVGDVSGRTDDDWSYAGWSLVIIYSSPSEEAHQLYLYDDFLYADQYTTHNLTIEGFLAPADSTGRLTSFTGEGDEVWGGQNQGPDDIDYVKVNGYYLSDAVNPWDNVWNGKSSGLGGGFIDGVDIETFDVSSYISPGDTSATVELGTGVDIWNLVYIILSFRSDISTSWHPYPVRIIAVNYNV